MVTRSSLASINHSSLGFAGLFSSTLELLVIEHVTCLLITLQLPIKALRFIKQYRICVCSYKFSPGI